MPTPEPSALPSPEPTPSAEVAVMDSWAALPSQVQVTLGVTPYYGERASSLSIPGLTPTIQKAQIGGYGGVSGTWYWGSFGLNWDAQFAYYVYQMNALAGGFPGTSLLFSVMEPAQGDLGLLWRFDLGPNWQLAVGPEGVFRYAMPDPPNPSNYWQGDRMYGGGGLLVKAGWRPMQSLIVDAQLASHYVAQQSALIVLDRFDVGGGLGVRYFFGDHFYTRLGYQGSVNLTTDMAGLIENHSLVTGFGLAF